MFTYLHVKNFKSLVDFTIDFRNNRNKPRKLNIIYGENGAGKSNIVEIFEFLKQILFSRVAIPNINIDEENTDIKRFLDLIINNHRIENIIQNYKTIGFDNNIHVECGINISNKSYEYVIKTNNERIIYEQLSVIQNKKNEPFFEINLKNHNIKKVTNNTNYIKDLSDKIDKYWGKHSFIAIILYEMQEKMFEYIKKNINKNFLQIIGIILDYSLSKQIYIFDGINSIHPNIPLFLEDINSGNIKQEKQHLLYTTEKALNNIIVPLYSDIKQVYYETKIEKNIIDYKLFCKKNIGNKIIDIPFTRESSGTQKLFKLIPLFIHAMDGHIAIIDEFDTGIHDLMVKALLENFANYIKGQLILTTHNTTLMESNIKKDNFYILDILPNREKEIYSISNYEKKLHPNLNIRKRYLSGAYGGVPYTQDIDFDELDEIISNAEKQKTRKK